MRSETKRFNGGKAAGAGDEDPREAPAGRQDGAVRRDAAECQAPAGRQDLTGRRETAARPAEERPWRDRTFRLTVFRRAMVSVAAALVICALAEGFWRNHLYFVYAACASSALLLLRAWLITLGYSRPRRPKTPEMLRGPRRPGRHRPAFRMTAGDFDDDLSALTLPDGESLPESWQRSSGIAGCVLAGLLMLLFSLL